MIRITIYSFIFLSVLFVNTSAISKSNYFDQGEKLFKEEKFSESKFKFEKDIVFNPKSEKSYLYLAKIFKKKNNDVLQEQNLNTVILLNPKTPTPFLMQLIKRATS